jgi:ATP-dependent helicase/DNAse subunit B
MIKLDTISPSRIKTYDTCLFKFYLSYIAKAEMKSNYGASNGSLIHDILENYTNGNDNEWLKRLYKGFAGQLEIIDRDEVKIVDSPLKLAKAKEYNDRKIHCAE